MIDDDEEQDKMELDEDVVDDGVEVDWRERCRSMTLLASHLADRQSVGASSMLEVQAQQVFIARTLRDLRAEDCAVLQEYADEDAVDAERGSFRVIGDANGMGPVRS
jgi:hypothetical protein